MDGSVINQEHASAISALLDAQRKSFVAEGNPSLEVRLDRLRRAKKVLLDNYDELLDLFSEDFGHRSKDIGVFSDIVGPIHAFNHAIKNVKKWMANEKRPIDFPLNLLGVRGEVMFQPKGVIGLITPWNFPGTMVWVPLAQMLAAGNRVVVKPSEHTPKTSEFMKKIFSEAFDETEIAFYNGGVEVSSAFAAQNWDHLMFTGAPFVGKLIMRAASEHLTPVTLELGGKSPVVVGRSADLKLTAERIATFKLMNAGQICLAPDYINVPEEKLEAFLNEYRAAVAQMYPTLRDNPDYTSIINERHRTRLEGYIREAGDKAEVLNPANESFDGQAEGVNKIPPALIVNPGADLKISHEEIFGPILIVRTYKDIGEVIDYVNDNPRPLALYYFGYDKAEEKRVLNYTTSGGVTVNDALWHGAHETLPFGGIGNSGMGHYHGIDGFKEFSHHKSIIRQPKLSVERLLGVIPPYGDKLRKNMKRELK